MKSAIAQQNRQTDLYRANSLAEANQRRINCFWLRLSIFAQFDFPTHVMRREKRKKNHFIASLRRYRYVCVCIVCGIWRIISNGHVYDTDGLSFVFFSFEKKRKIFIRILTLTFPCTSIIQRVPIFLFNALSEHNVLARENKMPFAPSRQTAYIYLQIF